MLEFQTKAKLLTSNYETNAMQDNYRSLNIKKMQKRAIKQSYR